MNNSIKVQFKKLHKDAVMPSAANPGDAGLDITVIDNGVSSLDRMGMIRSYKTGLSLSIPQGFVGLIFPRSSIYKHGVSLTNSVGVIDSGYRGEILVKFRVESEYAQQYEKGDRVAQLIVLPYPEVELEEVADLDVTIRNEQGFGSSDEQNSSTKS